MDREARRDSIKRRGRDGRRMGTGDVVRLPAVGTLNGSSNALEYEYRVKTATLDTLKRYSIISPSIFRVVQCLIYSGQWRPY
jgi:hypothetical protein